MARPASAKQQQQLAAAAVLVALLLVCTGTAPATVSGAVTCAQVVWDLTPCISYAMGAGGATTAPGQDCCTGIKSSGGGWKKIKASRLPECNTGGGGRRSKVWRAPYLALPSPPPLIKSLNGAGTAADRQATCACLKQATASMGALKPDLVASIPSKCGVVIPYPISRSTDCSKVQ